MFCLACTAPSPAPMCERCSAQTMPAPDTTTGGLLVVAAFVHQGPARRLVHALKYRGVTAAVQPFAAALAERVPASCTALVPVPRAVARSIRYGIDPAQVLALELSRITALPVVFALGPRLWWPRHAGARRRERTGIRFRRMGMVPAGAALVDDVVTTGATAAAAAATLGGLPALVLAATVAPNMGQGVSPSGGRVTGAPASGTNRPDLPVPPAR